MCCVHRLSPCEETYQNKKSGGSKWIPPHKVDDGGDEED